MSSNLILTLLERSIVVAMTDYFEPNYPRCWMWLAITFAPAALVSCLVSRPTPKGSQQDPFIVPRLYSCWTVAVRVLPLVKTRFRAARFSDNIPRDHGRCVEHLRTAVLLTAA
jgi:hypothetical protein